MQQQRKSAAFVSTVIIVTLVTIVIVAGWWLFPPLQSFFFYTLVAGCFVTVLLHAKKRYHSNAAENRREHIVLARTAAFSHSNLQASVLHHEPEIRYQGVLDGMLEGVQVLGADWKWLYINEAAIKHNRYTHAQLSGKSLVDVFEGIEDTHIFRVFNRCMQERVPAKLENEFVYPDGMVGVFELSVQPVPEGIVVFSIDITEKSKAARAAEKYAQQLTAIFDNTSEGFVILDTTAKIQAFNDMAARTVTVFSVYALKVGESIETLVNEERRSFVKDVVAKVNAGETVEYEREYPNNGTTAWIQFNFTPVRIREQIQGICITSRDITVHKREEELLQRNLTEKKALAGRLSDIINTLPGCIALLDRKGTIIETNKAWQHTAHSGCPEITGTVGDSYLRGAGRVHEAVRLVLGNKFPDYTHEYTHGEGSSKQWFLAVVTALADNQLGGAVVTHVNISKLRLLEQEKTKAELDQQRKIQQAHYEAQEKERNAIGIELHDNVNQILAAVSLMHSLIADDPARLNRLLPLCTEQISLALSENRKIAHEFWSPDLAIGSLSAQLEHLLRTMLEPANIKTLLDNAGFNENHLNEEQKLNLYRIAQEQCCNIIKYASAKTTAIHLQKKEGAIQMLIEDDGVGMDTSQKQTGIGLENIRGRVLACNGNLVIRTKPGHGFAVQVDIPFEQPVE